MSFPQLSLIIPAYNEEILLPQTLTSLHLTLKALPIEAEIIVVDNASTDATAKIAEAHGARVVFEAHRQIARARNAGAWQARGRFFIFIDADTEIEPALLLAAYTQLSEEKLCGGGARIAFSGPTTSQARRMAKTWNQISALLNWAAGSFIFCRRDAFEAIGGFSSEIYAGEEIFLSRALKRWGRRHKLPFRILTNAPPVMTSPRKLNWHSPLKIWWSHLSLALFPWRIRSAENCKFWYNRPKI